MLTEISSYQLQKSELDNKHEKKLDEYVETKRVYEEKQKEFDTFDEECALLVKKKNTLDEEVEKLKKKKEQLISEQERLSSEIEGFEPQIEELTSSVMKLKEQYDNLVAEFSEFERVKKGIEEEGIVDVNEFNAVVNQKVAESKSLIQWSENILKLLIEDVETLQSKIEKRRKAGA